MKPTPLYERYIRVNVNDAGVLIPYVYGEKKIFSEEAIRSACEWFLEQVNDLYHKLGKVKVWNASNDEVYDMCEDYIKKVFKLAFKDIFEDEKRDTK